MKIPIEKFLSKVLHESYSQSNKGFIIKNIFDKHKIPCNENDLVYLYDSNNDHPVKAGSTLALFEMLEDWDKYLLNPLHGTIFRNWTWYYKVKHHVRCLKSYTDKFGKKKYIFETSIEKECVNGITVVDHINLYIKKKNGTINRYVIYMTSGNKLVNPSTDASKYVLNIKEVLQ